MKIRDRSTLNLFDSRHSNADRAPLTVWLDPDEPIADNFAGGGGVRVAITSALARLGITDRRAQDVAVNHWSGALAMYRANHPHCRTYCEDIAKVDPVAASGGRRYAAAWFSPTCIFFSQAKGGPLDESATKVRGLCWLANTWASSPAKPRVLCMENVKPFVKFGPLHRQHNNGCSAEVAASRGEVDRKGKLKPKCLKTCAYLRPIKARIGTLFNAFIRRLSMYYRYVEWRIMKAHHYGAPTSRERFVLIASDNQVTWPEPTHGPDRAKPYRTAAECIDFSIPCPSIFNRVNAKGEPDPLADKTLARIKAGAWKFVLGAARPFIVHVTHGAREHNIDVPAPTVTGDNRGELALITPYMVHRSNGERAEVTKPDGTVIRGQDPRVYDVTKSIGTIVAGGIKHGLVAPILIKNNGGNNDRSGSAGQDIRKPLDTIATRDQKSVAAMYLAKLRGTSDAHIDASAHSVEMPTPTVSAGGTHLGAVAAYLVRYNGESAAESLDKPISTIDTRDRFALVTMEMEREVSERAIRVAKFLGLDAPIVLEIDGEQWVLVDIGFRMLTPRELFRCQGFPESYRIEVDHNGKTLTKTAQIKCVGNSVPPQLAEAVLIAALQTVRYEPESRMAA